MEKARDRNRPLGITQRVIQGRSDALQAVELLQKSMLVLDINAGAVRDMQVYCGQLAEVELTAAAFGPVIAGFFREVSPIIPRLETRRALLNSLATILSQNTPMVCMLSSSVPGYTVIPRTFS